MKLLCIEDTADGLLDLAVRARGAGHAVKFHCASAHGPVGRGLVECVGDWRPWARWADLIVLGGNGKWMIEMDRLKAQGVPIIGAGAEAVKWELDRMAGMAAFRRARIPVPPYRQCKNLDEAIAYVAERGEGCAVKVCGDVIDKTTSVVGKEARDVIWRLECWRREGKRFPDGLMVQDRIVGIEMGVGAWVGPEGFVEGWEENFEEKRLFAGGLGPNCGEAGTVMRLVKRSKLADLVLRPFEDRLVSLGYVGNVDVNVIIDDDGVPWPLEWTMRLGWPAFNIELSLHQGDPVEWLATLVQGAKPAPRRLDTIAVGVVLALPPYPFGNGKPEEVNGVPIWGVTPGIEGNLHLTQCEMGRGVRVVDGRIERVPALASAGNYVLISTGTGESVVEARGEVFRVLERLKVPASPFWRIDIGQRLRQQLDALHEQGFALGMRYA